ncbi:MAG TPA: hypothetical protein VD836_19145 [Solirubrobacteraceae bacterium]|nr:hypothetical protein [Solirubrobacteraceae bacterium]
MIRALPLAVACALFAAPAAAAAAPTGGVSGVRDPASGVMRLVVLASAGDGLLDAAAALDGAEVARAPFDCDAVPSACPGGQVELLVPTTQVADGPHRLTVTVTDQAGATAVLTDRVLTVSNAPVLQRTSVTIRVGSRGGGGAAPGESGGTGGPPPAVPACERPRLRVRAAWARPELRGVRLVLRAGRRYRFAGRLTCLRDGRRVAAPAGTRIRLTQRHGGVPLRRRTVRTGPGGRFALRVLARTRRTLVFSVRSGGRTVASARLPIVVVHDGVPA